MLENARKQSIVPVATVDPSPLWVEVGDNLQQVLKTMAMALKTYALVHRDMTPVGIMSYDNVAQAVAHQADFSDAAVEQWMTSLSDLPCTLPLDWPLALDQERLNQPYLAIVNQTHNCLGLLAADGFYPLATTPPPQAQAELTACYHSAALLHQQRERLALALEGAQMGTWDWDLARGTIVVSEELENLLGLTPGEFDGTYDTLFNRVHEGDQDRVHEVLQQSIRLGRRYNLEFRIRHRDGRIRWLSSRGQVFDDGQQDPRLAGVTLDISEQKRAEAEIKHQSQRERLVGEIAQRIRTLLDLDSILAQTVTSVREFIAADRVIVIQCGADMGGEVIQESCEAPNPPMLGWALRDPWSVGGTFISHYREGRGLAVEDIYTQNLPPDQLEFLEYFQIKAEIVVPLLHEQNLWGLLIAHQCKAPRAWHTADVRLLQNLATQVGIAIQQAKLHRELTLANQQLKRMAYLDGLTQVANRRR
ncbi:MAG: PAS domain-containing protein, partial [Cyanobacteria bacterium J06638_6]